MNIYNNASPLYIKISHVLIGLLAFFYIIYIGQEIILPFVFSVILAILLNPVMNYLLRKKFSYLLAIFTTLLFAILVIAGLFYFLSSQLGMFGEALPQLKQKLNLGLKDIVHWASQKFNLSTSKINNWIDQKTSEGLNKSTTLIGETLTTVTTFIVAIFLIPVYIFLLLYYKPLLLKFISQLFPNEMHVAVVDVLTATKILIQSYLIGLLIEAAIVAALNTTTLLIIGIDYALLLGVLCALLNIIPYIGGLIAIVLTMLFAWVTKSPLSAGLVLLAHLTVQFIDNNFLMPKIVGSKVKINALVSILVVLIGGELCGVPGMFLSIPVTAIIKVICDKIEPLKSLGFLLGDTMPPIGKTIFYVRKVKVEQPGGSE